MVLEELSLFQKFIFTARNKMGPKEEGKYVSENLGD